MTDISDSRVIVALDFPAREPALALVDQLDPAQCKLKVGKEMFTRLGPQFVEQLVGQGFKVFLDLKFHDIPNTVAAACAAAAELGVWMINLHAAGGRKMMETARERLEQFSQRPKLIAVTILTSLSDDEIHEIGYSGSAESNVLRMARLAESCGLDGIVCSPREAAPVRTEVSDEFLLVTPGVRPAQASTDDQKRIMTPADAMNAGASYLVVGRPITAAEDPMARLQAIQAEVQTVLGAA